MKQGRIVERGDDVTDARADAIIAFGNAIIAAVEMITEDRLKAGKPVDLVTVIDALVSVLAHHVAGIPDDGDRQMHFSRIGVELLDLIFTNRDLGTHAEVFSKDDLQ